MTALTLWLELRKWRRLQKAINACYPDVEVKIIRADRLAELTALDEPRYELTEAGRALLDGAK